MFKKEILEKFIASGDLSFSGTIELDFWAFISHAPSGWCDLFSLRESDEKNSFTLRLKGAELGQAFFGDGARVATPINFDIGNICFDAWNKFGVIRVVDDGEVVTKIFLNNVEVGAGVNSCITPYPTNKAHGKFLRVISDKPFGFLSHLNIRCGDSFLKIHPDNSVVTNLEVGEGEGRYILGDIVSAFFSGRENLPNFSMDVKKDEIGRSSRGVYRVNLFISGSEETFYIKKVNLSAEVVFLEEVARVGSWVHPEILDVKKNNSSFGVITMKEARGEQYGIESAQVVGSLNETVRQIIEIARSSGCSWPSIREDIDSGFTEKTFNTILGSMGSDSVEHHKGLRAKIDFSLVQDFISNVPMFFSHGDIKSDNFFYCNGRLVLIDFGECGLKPAGSDYFHYASRCLEKNEDSEWLIKLARELSEILESDFSILVSERDIILSAYHHLAFFLLKNSLPLMGKKSKEKILHERFKMAFMSLSLVSERLENEGF